MYWAPWAKLMMLSRPKMTDRPEAQHGVERAVDEPDQELAEQRLGRDAEDSGHARGQRGRAESGRVPPLRPAVMLLLHQRALALVEGPERLLGGMVARIL